MSPVPLRAVLEQGSAVDFAVDLAMGFAQRRAKAGPLQAVLRGKAQARTWLPAIGAFSDRIGNLTASDSAAKGKTSRSHKTSS